jgi:hypothetical protein
MLGTAETLKAKRSRYGHHPRYGPYYRLCCRPATSLSDDRHVFGFTGCAYRANVATGDILHRGTAVPDHMSQAVRFTNPVAITTHGVYFDPL